LELTLRCELAYAEQRAEHRDQRHQHVQAGRHHQQGDTKDLRHAERLVAAGIDLGDEADKAVQRDEAEADDGAQTEDGEHDVAVQFPEHHTRAPRTNQP
jgi:hypothetical protein